MPTGQPRPESFRSIRSFAITSGLRMSRRSATIASLLCGAAGSRTGGGGDRHAEIRLEWAEGRKRDSRQSNYRILPVAAADPAIRRQQLCCDLVELEAGWQQGGVYARKYGPGATRPSFETQVNVFTSSYQWEPDCAPSGTDEIIAVWSSWGQTGKDYDVVARRVVLPPPQGYLSPAGVSHPVGISTTRLKIHVLDSLALTGHTYEAVFDSLGGRKALVRVRDLTSGDTVVSVYPIDRGEGVLYLTPGFHGVALEIVPEFDLEIDFARSYMINRSGTTIPFTVGFPSAGLRLIAPVDIALIWGSLDTLSNGMYAAPLDTAKGPRRERPWSRRFGHGI